MSQSSSPNLTGRGGANTNDSNSSQTINILISTTTGTQFDISVETLNTIEHLKKVISKKLKVNKDKISLLFKERELQDGTLKDNGIVEGSKVVLTPNVETGLLTQRAENTVMQALESLNDSQVNDFLSGKSPLNLSVRLGDHMMLIQLQLSTINPSTVAAASTQTTPQQLPIKSNVAMPSTSKAGSSGGSTSRTSGLRKNIDGNSRVFDLFTAGNNASSSTRSPTDNFEHNDLSSYLIKDVDNLESIVKSLSNFMDEDEDSKQALDQSPIKSLSNLVSNSISAEKSPPTPSTSSSSTGSPPTTNTTTAATNLCAEQIDPNLFHSITSCLCKRLDSSRSSFRTADPLYNPSCFSHHPHQSRNNPFLHKTSQNAIIKSKSRHQHSSSSSFKKHHSTNTILPFTTDHQSSSSSSSTTTPQLPQPATEETMEPIAGTIDNPALAEASRNLTQTLRKLSKKVFPRGDGSRRITSGAVIESMKHHGKGIYSGTFSGTLNPALQDKHGRPKRDISTIIHILNDLLSAGQQCTRTGAKIYFEPTTAVGLAPNGSQSAPASPVTKSSSSPPRRASSGHQSEFCSRCPPASSSKSSRFNEDYTGTIKSSTHRRRTSSGASSSNTYCHNHMAAAPPSVPSSLEIENSKTKYKLEQLRQVMQEKKARREARKLASLPYHTVRGPIQTLSPTTTTTITALASPSTTQPPAASPNANVESIIEEVDTVA